MMSCECVDTKAAVQAIAKERGLEVLTMRSHFPVPDWYFLKAAEDVLQHCVVRGVPLRHPTALQLQSQLHGFIGFSFGTIKPMPKSRRTTGN